MLKCQGKGLKRFGGNCHISRVGTLTPFMTPFTDRINNPYWVIKELYNEHKNIMTKIIEPLR